MECFRDEKDWTLINDIEIKIQIKMEQYSAIELYSVIKTQSETLFYTH